MRDDETRGSGDEQLQWDQAIGRDPNDAVIRANYALWLEQQQRYSDAERQQKAAVALLPANAKIYANFANLIATAARGEEALVLHRRALQIQPRSHIAWSNFGAFLADNGREAEAEQAMRRALQLRANYARARVNLAYLLLAQGRMMDGWQLHEARYADELADRGSVPPPFAFPQWRGEPLSDRSLVIWPEQGFGDEIQFFRYVALLKALGAARITWVCKAPLKKLFAAQSEVDDVLTAEEAQDHIAPHDYWSFPMSLPLYCTLAGSTLPDGILAAVPYLRVDTDWQCQRSCSSHADELTVGLVWRGNANNAYDAERSLPSVSTFEPLRQLRGVRFVALQYGCQEELPITNLGATMHDFADAAAMLCQIDLLIGVDTAIAHLAGAIGKPCWLLLPAYKTDWRWGKADETSVWYPYHRLFRQERRGDWEAVIARVKNELAFLVASRS